MVQALNAGELNKVICLQLISYQIPTYRENGRPLVHFAAQPKHLSLTVVSLKVINAFRDELRDFDVSGRTVRFSATKPLPATLVKRIVKARVQESKNVAVRDPGPGWSNRQVGQTL